MAHCLRRGSRIQSAGRLVFTQPTMPEGVICSMPWMPRSRGPWKV